jgi:hypothetical protein
VENAIRRAGDAALPHFTAVIALAVAPAASLLAAAVPPAAEGSPTPPRATSRDA